VLPDHDHPSHLYFDGRAWKYWCPACDFGFSLAEVRAIFAYADVPLGGGRDATDGPWRKVRRPGSTEVNRWAELLDYECGLLEPRPVGIVLPRDLSSSAMVVAEQIRLLIGLRSEERWTENRSDFTFARRMVRARCHLSDDVAKAAMAELRERKVIVCVGKTGPANVYRLGSRAEVFGDGSLFERFKEAFDAEEIDPRDDANEVGDG